LASPPRGWNAYIHNGADVTANHRLISNQLASRSPEDLDRWTPELAVSVVADPDGLGWVVSLQPKASWQLPDVDWESGDFEWLKGEGPNGRHRVTADDFVFPFELIQDTSVEGRVSSMRNYYERFESVEAVDDLTLHVRVKERSFLDLAMFLELTPLPRWLYGFDPSGQAYAQEKRGEWINSHWYQGAIGTGPYRLKEQSKAGLVFQANSAYFGEPASFDRIERLHVQDSLHAFNMGEIDLVIPLPEDLARTGLLEGESQPTDPKLRRVNYETMTYFYMGWNQERAPFGDKAVRQAMTLSLDRERILKEVFQGLGSVTSGPFPKQSPCYDRSVEPWPFDLELASSKLEAAGWSDRDGNGVRERMVDGEEIELRFTLLSYGYSEAFRSLTEIWREDLARIGVVMEVEEVAWVPMLERMDTGDFDAYTGAWVPGWDTDLTQLWHSSQADVKASSNRIGFRNAEADRLAEALRAAQEPVDRTAICHEFHALVHEEQPYTFFFQRERAVLYRAPLNEPEFSLLWPYADPAHWSFSELPRSR
jgi:ABC-type transport system substrate-binding protein